MYLSSTHHGSFAFEVSLGCGEVKKDVGQESVLPAKSEHARGGVQLETPKELRLQ